MEALNIADIRKKYFSHTTQTPIPDSMCARERENLGHIFALHSYAALPLASHPSTHRNSYNKVMPTQRPFDALFLIVVFVCLYRLFYSLQESAN